MLTRSKLHTVEMELLSLLDNGKLKSEDIIRNFTNLMQEVV